MGFRLLLLEPFALGVALLALFQPGGLGIFADTVARSTLCLLAMVLLTATPRVSEVLSVLLRLKVPRLLVTTIAFAYRYLFVVFDEMGRLRPARRSRTFLPRRRAAWASSATIAGRLFVRASERAERVALAMAARGWK